jgi:uncharacterized membrane protein
MSKPTVEVYQHAEREAAQTESRRGFRVHAVVTVAVSLALVILNMTIASQFAWSIFAVAGMGIGLFMHWFFGVVHGDESMQRHQQDIEHRAAA